jgi:hypothetical protein
MDNDKEVEYKSIIDEMRNIIRNQEQVIEHLIFQSMNIKVEEDDEDLEIDVLYKPNII